MNAKIDPRQRDDRRYDDPEDGCGPLPPGTAGQQEDGNGQRGGQGHVAAREAVCSRFRDQGVEQCGGVGAVLATSTLNSSLLTQPPAATTPVAKALTGLCRTNSR